MQTIAELLEQHPFFQGLKAEDIAFIAGCGQNVAFQEDEYIFREGESADRFYILRHGRVALETFVPERGPLTIETVAEGDVLGWSWLFPPYHWSSDARAVQVTRAVALDGICLRQKCENDARLGYALMQRFARIMMDRLDATKLRLLDIYGNVPAF